MAFQLQRKQPPKHLLGLMINNKMNQSTQKKLYILGAGGFAREIYSYLKDSDFGYQGYTLVGFLNDNRDSLEGFDTIEHPIVGAIKNLTLGADDAVIMGLANCQFKQVLYQHYTDLGIEILSYIHPTALVGNAVDVGAGSVLGPYSLATTNVKIGKCNTINVMSTLGHDVILGDFCTISGHCDITGGAELGESVFLGSHTTIIPKVVVGSGAVVGAGSVVIKKIAPGVTVFGNPARKIK